MAEDRGQKTEDSSVGRLSPSVSRQIAAPYLDSSFLKQVTQKYVKKGGDGFVQYVQALVLQMDLNTHTTRIQNYYGRYLQQ